MILQRPDGGGDARPVERVAMEGIMRHFSWDLLIQSLVLIRLGQELGTDSPLARAVHDVVQAMLAIGR